MKKNLDLYGNPEARDPEYILDAQTGSGRLRVIALEACLATVMKDYQEWVTEHLLSERDIWYADLYRQVPDHGTEHIAVLSIEPDGLSVRMEPVRGTGRHFIPARQPGLYRRFMSLRAGKSAA